MERAKRFAQLGVLLQVDGNVGNSRVRDLAKRLFNGSLQVGDVPHRLTDLDDYGLQMVDALARYLFIDKLVDQVTRYPGSRPNPGTYKLALLRQLMAYRGWLQEFTINRPADEVEAFWRMADEFAEAAGQSTWRSRRSIVCESSVLIAAGHLDMNACTSNTNEDIHNGIDAWAFDCQVPIQIKSTDRFDGAVVVGFYEQLVLPGGTERTRKHFEKEFTAFRERIQRHCMWQKMGDAYFLIAGNYSYDPFSAEPKAPLLDCMLRIKNQVITRSLAM